MSSVYTILKCHDPGIQYERGGIVQALKTGDVAGLYDTLEAAITYLACHAQRAHPKRDRQTGRLQLGLEPLLESNDLIEFAEAA